MTDHPRSWIDMGLSIGEFHFEISATNTGDVTYGIVHGDEWAEVAREDFLAMLTLAKCAADTAAPPEQHAPALDPDARSADLALVAGPMNRAGAARVNAGLSVGQAALLLGIDPGILLRAEADDTAFAELDHHRLATLYDVGIAWMRGETERRDYAFVDSLGGAENLSDSDRENLAELVASLPMRRFG